MNDERSSLIASLRQRAEESIAAPPVHYGFGDGGVSEFWISVPPRTLISLLDTVESARELVAFLGPDGSPDLRYRTSAVELGLEKLDG